MTLRKLHAVSALLLSAFLVMHLVNHLAGLNGIDAHIAYMKTARIVYRQPFIEALILLTATFQVVSGMTLVIRGRGQRHSLVAWLQMLSGISVAIFLVIHVGSVMVGRLLLDLDTNFYFAAAGFHVHPFEYAFAPYYFLGVLALFTHLGCALYWKFEGWPATARALVMSGTIILGIAVATTIVLILDGKVHTVEIPAPYTDTFHPGK